MNELTGEVMTEKAILLDIERLTITGYPITPVSAEDKIALMQSVEEVGLLYPLLVAPIDGNDGSLEVLDGRTRLEILKELGERYVPCIIIDDDPLRAGIIPYDTELYRRHLDTGEKDNYAKVRRDKKRELNERYIGELTSTLPPGIRERITLVSG